MASLTPAQQLIKIVKEEMTSLMGGEERGIHLSGTPPVPIMLVGLHGCGKTTTTGKLARYFRRKRSGLISFRLTFTARRPLTNCRDWDRS